MTRVRLLVATCIVCATVGGGWYAWRVHAVAARAAAVAPPPDLTAPNRQRVRVEVLNATKIRGLARRATFVLRDQGLDVVLIGTESAQQDSTLVLDRSNHPEWAQRVADALGGARVEARPDSTHYVDVTVLLGRTWRAPPEPLNP
ncbi:MAG TPA: LytR C-terminal domain-containing protein [Gemmatimonadaceae bacterium]|nr:LytR C-terminal domain-containing protein [Gemmatimonadaceae bacterium]